MLVSEFEAIAKSLKIGGQTDQVTFMFADEFEANLEADGIDPENFPLIVYETAITSTGTFTQANVIQATAPLQFMFLELDEEDSTPEQSDEILKRMRSLANQFVLRIQNSTTLLTPGKDIESFTLSNVFKSFDSTVTGVLLSVTIPLNEDVNYCV